MFCDFIVQYHFILYKYNLFTYCILIWQMPLVFSLHSVLHIFTANCSLQYGEPRPRNGSNLTTPVGPSQEVA